MLSGYAFSELVATGTFPAEVVEEANALGASVTVTNDPSQPAWVGVSLGDDGAYSGGAEPWLEPVGAGVVSTGLSGRRRLSPR